MRRKGIAALVAGASLAAALVVASPAAAADGPVGGCPTGDDWFLAPTSSVIPEFDNGNYADQNGDGYACFRINRGHTVLNNVPSYTWKDNTNPLPET